MYGGGEQRMDDGRLTRTRSLIQALGARDGLRAAWQLKRGTVISFGGYVLENDSSAGYHLTESLPKLRRLAEYVAPSARAVVDVGAHCGLFAAFAKERSPEAAVICVEADPQLVPRIEQNLARFNNWTVACAAATDVDGGRVPFYRSARSTQTSSLLRRAVEVFDTAPEVLDVPTATLDMLCVDMPVIDVLKIDVQGAELGVLEGAAATLSRTRTLLIEASLLDDDVHVLLTRLRDDFGPPAFVNPVYAGADLAYQRLS